MSSKCVIAFNLYNDLVRQAIFFHVIEEMVNTNSGYIVGPRHITKK